MSRNMWFTLKYIYINIANKKIKSNATGLPSCRITSSNILLEENIFKLNYSY